MNHIKYYACPRTVKEAMGVLGGRKYKAMALAGCTLVSKTLPETVETYLDIKKLPLNHIKLSGKNLAIGATATFDDIERSKLCRSWAGGVISLAAAKCSSQLIRNMATIGGNIARPHSFNIFPVVLLGLDAQIRLLTKTGVKTFPFQRLYAADFNCKPGLDCLILEIIIPAAAKNMKCSFEKLAKTDSSWESYIKLFFAAQKRGGLFKNARVAVGSLSPKPFRARNAETALEGNPVSTKTIAEAVAAFKTDLEAAKATDYKKEAAANLLKRYFEL